MARATNQGARLQNAMSNWESLPPTVDRAIDRVQHSIRPTSLPRPPTPLPSPATAAAAPRMRLATFNPGDCRTWTFPEFRDDTVVIADSNGRTLALHTPPNWRVAAYRGARIEDVAQFLRRQPLPDAIKTVIIAAGISNKDNHEAAAVDHITALRDVLAVQTRAVHVLAVPYFEDEPIQHFASAVNINRLFADLFSDAG